jgi:hypothetical protein
MKRAAQAPDWGGHAAATDLTVDTSVSRSLRGAPGDAIYRRYTEGDAMSVDCGVERMRMDDTQRTRAPERAQKTGPPFGGPVFGRVASPRGFEPRSLP